jgi:hypothetical protein
MSLAAQAWCLLRRSWLRVGACWAVAEIEAIFFQVGIPIAKGKGKHTQGVLFNPL